MVFVLFWLINTACYLRLITLYSGCFHEYNSSYSKDQSQLISWELQGLESHLFKFFRLSGLSFSPPCMVRSMLAYNSLPSWVTSLTANRPYLYFLKYAREVISLDHECFWSHLSSSQGLCSLLVETTTMASSNVHRLISVMINTYAVNMSH